MVTSTWPNMAVKCRLVGGGIICHGVSKLYQAATSFQKAKNQPSVRPLWIACRGGLFV
jgi:hypothetical protein